MCLKTHIERSFCHILPAHLFGDAHETVGEDGQLDGVQLQADDDGRSVFDEDLQVALGGQAGRASRFDDDRAQLVDDDRRTDDRVAGQKIGQ